MGKNIFGIEMAEPPMKLSESRLKRIRAAVKAAKDKEKYNQSAPLTSPATD